MIMAVVLIVVVVVHVLVVMVVVVGLGYQLFSGSDGSVSGIVIRRDSGSVVMLFVYSSDGRASEW